MATRYTLPRQKLFFDLRMPTFGLRNLKAGFTGTKQVATGNFVQEGANGMKTTFSKVGQEDLSQFGDFAKNNKGNILSSGNGNYVFQDANGEFKQMTQGENGVWGLGDNMNLSKEFNTKNLSFGERSMEKIKGIGKLGLTGVGVAGVGLAASGAMTGNLGDNSTK